MNRIPLPRIETVRLVAPRIIGPALIFVVVVCLSIPAARVGAQSGRKSTVTPQPSPSPSPTASDQDEQTATNGTIAGEGETIEGDTLTVNTNLVTVPVKVMDRVGRNILNLQRRDFHIFENGVEQRIAYFATVDAPFTVVLLLDTSGSTEFKIEDIQNAGISFVNQLKPQDRVMVMSFDDKIQTFCDPTNDRAELVQAIRQTRTGGNTRLYDAVDQVVAEKLKSITGRKAVVLFTDGVDTASTRATYRSTLKLVQESDTAVYVVAYDTSGDLFGGSGTGTVPINGGRIPGRGGTIGSYPNPNGGGYPNPGGGSNPNPNSGRYPNPGSPSGNGPVADYRFADQYLHEVVLQSGGEYYRGDTIVGLSGAFRNLADELRRQYSIGYYPPSGQTGQRRDIKVRVNQPDLVVKARDSYIYTQPAAKNNKQ